MIKIHKTELLKGFILYETIFVVLPVIAIRLAILIFALSLSEKISEYIPIENIDVYSIYFIYAVLTFIIVMSLYFILPGLFASNLFHFSIFGISPKGITAWILTVAIYSLAALLFAILMSLYKPSQKQNKPGRGYIIKPILRGTPQKDNPG